MTLGFFALSAHWATPPPSGGGRTRTAILHFREPIVFSPRKNRG